MPAFSSKITMLLTCRQLISAMMYDFTCYFFHLCDKEFRICHFKIPLAELLLTNGANPSSISKISTLRRNQWTRRSLVYYFRRSILILMGETEHAKQFSIPASGDEQSFSFLIYGFYFSLTNFRIFSTYLLSICIYFGETWIQNRLRS